IPNLRGIAYSPDGRFLAAINHHGAVAVHDSATGKERWKSAKKQKDGGSVLFSADGKLVLSSGSEQFIRRRDAVTGKELDPLDCGEANLVDDIVLSPDGRTLAVHHVKILGETQISYWDATTSKRLAGFLPEDRRTSGIQWMPGGKELLIHSYSHIQVRDALTHKIVNSIPLEDMKDLSGQALVPGAELYVQGIRDASISSDGKLLAVSTFHDSRIFDYPSGTTRKKLDTEKLYPWHWTFSPDGEYLLLVASQKTFVWKLDALLPAKP
ncbi:MAG: WD40 repeat domain-containing protein, partial [Tepidisphaeraceae bacterium]